MGALSTFLGYLYMALVGWIKSKKGFRWNWFTSLTLLFMFLTLALPATRNIAPDESSAENLILGVISVCFSYPIPGFLAIKADPLIPSNLSRSLRLILKGVLYFSVYTLATIAFAFILALIHA